MNRRDFVKAGLRCAALAAVPSPLLAIESGGKARIPIGLIGATHSHAPDKLKAVAASPEWDLVGACEESDAGRRVCEAAGVRILSLDELLSRCRVAVVESAVRDHAEHALLALRAGKHVHVEKPAAASLIDMRQLVALARERKLLLQTGYMWRYHPGFLAIFEAVRKGWLGNVFMVRGHISNNLAPSRRPEWGEFKGGSLFELGSHLVDSIVRLLGRPRAVTPLLRRHGRFTDSFNDNNVAVFEYEKAMAILVNTALQSTERPRRAFEVLGSKGCALLEPIEPPGLEIELTEAAGPYKRGRQTVSLPPYKRYEADFAELAAAVRGERSLSVGLDEELLVQETLLKASDMA